ncbi:ROK family transcriptional regulator [Glaciihabitans sp. dw_435]|uniref:ROK family transcriptional regulator n=1 Tax=Glaciihabitans sp. dw_435 TaxID=2720081 RepID=UPI001BD3784E|nr:ROK family protein [Glaciihabitans sp. dw_435]
MKAPFDRVSLRDRTRDDLYELIAEGNELTRPELVVLTGMSRTTVNQAVGRLVAEGRVAESEQKHKGPGSGSGRPATSLIAVANGDPVVGIDFGHNHIQVAVADALGRPLGERYVEVDVDLLASEAMDLAADLAITLIAEHSLGRPASVVAGIPGPLDRGSGLVQSSTILSSWVGLAPAVELERRLGVPVQIENDAILGAVGELRAGAGRDIPNFLYVKASHGIGAAIIIGGHPYRGTSGIAGEIGHTHLSGHTEACRCGNRGCLEAVVSIQAVRDQVLHTHPNAHPGDVDLASEPDEVTARILIEAGRIVGRVLSSMCDLLNPEAVIIGGELGATGPQFLGGIAASIERYSQPATARALQILPASLGIRAELVGALQLAAGLARR